MTQTAFAYLLFDFGKGTVAPFGLKPFLAFVPKG